MKMSEIRKNSQQQLVGLISKEQQSLRQNKVDMRTKEVKNTRSLRVQRRTIARMLTAMKEIQLSSVSKDKE